jgi:hypothetical protein
MMNRAILLATAVAVLGGADMGEAADKPKAAESVPLSMTIEGTAKYTLDPAIGSEEDLKKGFAVDKFPNPPKVDLKLVIKNTGDTPVQVWTGGDPLTIELQLKGDGAVSVKPRLMMTADYRSPRSTEVAAGKTVEIPLKQLSGGKRGAGEYWYWTKAGEYELTATLNTAVSPAPAGADKADGGYGKVKVANPAFKIVVEKK